MVLIPRYPGEDVPPSRRALLVAALRAGVVAGLAAATPAPAAAQLLGQVPRKLPPGRSIYSARGSITVDGRPATVDTVIAPGAVVAAADRAEVIFVMDDDAYILRENSRLELPKPGVVAASLRLFSGALLSVFGRRQRRMETAVATIGIRGTGIYVESEPDRSYVCTCYGTSDLQAADAPDAAETVVSQHHDAPRYILGPSEPGARIRKAPFKNHSDLELALIEELVGRTPPFSTIQGYDSPFDPY